MVDLPRHDAPHLPMTDNQPDSADPGVNAGTSTSTSTTDVEANNNSSPDRDEHPDAPLDTSKPAVNVHAYNTTTTTTTTPDDSSSSTTHRRAANVLLEIADDDVSPPGTGASTPRFLQDTRSGNLWKRRVIYPIRRGLKKLIRWSHGPPNPELYRINPIFQPVQEYPLSLMDRFFPQSKHRFWLFFFYFFIWLVSFVLVKRADTLSSEIAGWGEAQTLGCGATYWSSGNSCGLDGNDCRPFNGSGFPFKCPGNCNSQHVLNPHAVGDQELIYRTLVIGGPPNIDGNNKNNNISDAVYRGDSYVCSAAIHAGVISAANGGCGVVEVIGEHSIFIGSQRNGIASASFDSYFPLSFRFASDADCSAQDVRWKLLAISTVFSGVLSLVTSSPALFFFPTFVGIFWTIGMAIDPPTHQTVAGLFSLLLGRFLPAMFCAWVMFDRMGVRLTLNKLTAQAEKTILWLGPCWVGAMDNYTLSSIIPIQRLNAHDIHQQPGAKAALAIIIIVLVVIVISQIWFFRQEGRLVKYLKLYGLFGIAIGISLAIPGLSLRIHHYILALIFLPGTSLQTRPSLVYQGLLIGLFINGIARWGFDPILQTPLALRGDAHKGTSLPILHSPIIELANRTLSTTTATTSSNITFTWDPPTEVYNDGISVLVNDVERFRAYFDDVRKRPDAFTWFRDQDFDMPEYFRFAFMSGSESGDYTRAGIWTADGEWMQMAAGPSKVKGRSLSAEDRVLLKD